MIWTGLVDTFWDTAGNWDTLFTPGSGDTCYINTGAPLYPMQLASPLQVAYIDIALGNQASQVSIPAILTTVSGIRVTTALADTGTPVTSIGPYQVNAAVDHVGPYPLAGDRLGPYKLTP